MLSPLISMARTIRQARFKRKLTQSAVAKSVGCGQSYVAQVAYSSPSDRSFQIPDH